MIYVEYPNNHSHHTVDRYRQGVLLQFRGKGFFYHFDSSNLFQALIAGAVLLASASAITDLLAVNLYRFKRRANGKWGIELSATSRVLRAKRSERVSPEFVMASQSMLSALAVGSFRSLDTDGDGVVDAENLVSAFARVGGITFEEAVEMTKLIMHKGDRDAGLSDGRLTFTEFCSVLSGDHMGFDQLLRYMNERHCQGTDQGGFMKLDLKIDRAQFEELRAEHFRGLAVYALGLVHGVLFAYMLRSKPKAEPVKDVAEEPVAEEQIPPPPLEPHPDDIAGPTPRTLLKNVLNEVNLNEMVPPPPAVHTPTVMSIDDYEALKKGAKDKSTTKRRKSIRTPKKVEAFSPS